MMTHLGSKLFRVLSGIAVLLIVSSAAIAQPDGGTVKRLTLKSTVLGEDRIILVRTPAEYATNKANRSGVNPR